MISYRPNITGLDAISLVTINATANGLSVDSDQVLTLGLSSGSTTGALSSTDWTTFNGKQVAGNYITALTGDATASGPGSVALTLATVNGNVGSFGSASSVMTQTVNAKGLTTAAASVSIQIAESQVTNLVSDLAGKQAIGNYITALTGDVTATGPNSVAATLATVNSNVGSFTNASITVNAKGLITAASSGSGSTASFTKNYIMNSNMDFCQRVGSAFSFSTPTSATYTLDRWRNDYDGTIGAFTVSQQAFTVGQTAVPNEPTSFYRWNQTSAGSGSTFRTVKQPIESVRTLAGKSCSVSVWLKADTTRTVAVGMTQNFGTGGSPSSSVAISTQNASVTTTWTQFTFTFTVPSISGKTLGTTDDGYLSLDFNLPLNTTMTIDIAQVMANESSSLAAWQYISEGTSLNREQELAICQRYYEKSYLYSNAPATVVNLDNCTTQIMGGDLIVPGIAYKVMKRMNSAFGGSVNTALHIYSAAGTDGNITRNSNSGDSIINGVNGSSYGFTYIQIGTNGNPGGTFYYAFTASAEL